jgi:hypothetical protein
MKDITLDESNSDDSMVEFSCKTATGRAVGVMPITGSHGYVLGFIDGKPGSLPDKYSCRFTGVSFAYQAAKALARETFEVAEEAIKRQGIKRNK